MNMNERAVRSHTISGAFVFLLRGVFAVFSTLMVLLGAQLYRDIVDQTDIHNADRILSSYVINVVRGNDSADSVGVENRGGLDVLVFSWDDGMDVYETCVYCHNGTLRECFSAAGEDFDPDYGETICAASAFEPELKDNVLRIRVADERGREKLLHMALRCDQEVVS